MSNLTICMKCGKGYLLDYGHMCPMDTLHDIPGLLEKKLEVEKKRGQELKEYQEKVIQSSSRARKNKMRNKPCLCGSGKKFKVCCWNKYK